MRGIGLDADKGAAAWFKVAIEVRTWAVGARSKEAKVTADASAIPLQTIGHLVARSPLACETVCSRNLCGKILASTMDLSPLASFCSEGHGMARVTSLPASHVFGADQVGRFGGVQHGFRCDA